MSQESERIAKRIARAGLCSRRNAEQWILEGRVSLNGEIVLQPAINVTSEDKICVDQKVLPECTATRLWRYHKPKGLITTHKDPQKRRTVFSQLPPELPRMISIGRLDTNTEGLLLLTNDGNLQRKLELPSTAWRRRYRVRAFGNISQKSLDSIREGLTVNGIHYGPIEATLERKQGGNVWLTMVIKEGKNREIKRILEHFDLTVNRLIRTSYGPFLLGNLAPGAIEEVKTKTLNEQLGTEHSTPNKASMTKSTRQL